MSRVLRICAICLAAGLPFALAACGSSKSMDETAEALIERAGGGNVEIDSENGTMSFSNEDGSISAGDNISVPDDFPSGVPTPKDAKLQTAYSTGDDFNLGYVVDDWKDASAAYISDLEAAGFSGDNSYTSSDMVSKSFDDGTYSVTVIAGATDGSSGYLTVQVSPSNPSMSGEEDVMSEE
jgi:hypothetical protein